MASVTGEPVVVEKQVKAVQPEEKGVVIVHCRFSGEGAIRVWRSTYLLMKGSQHRSRLLHAENISLYPQWTEVGKRGHTFTLFFDALPGSCTVFDLQEIIPQAGGFFIEGIVRNESDVYNVELI
jgi:hypothetical protein